MICCHLEPFPVYRDESEDTCDSSLSPKPEKADVISFTYHCLSNIYSDVLNLQTSGSDITDDTFR